MRWLSGWLRGWFELIWGYCWRWLYWCGCALGLDVGDGGEDDKGSAVIGGGGGACMGSGEVSERDCCRLPGVIRELWKDLPYSFPFFLEFFFQ